MQTVNQIADRLTKFMDAWQELAPDKTFGGMTLAEFKSKVQPSFDTRDAVRTATSQLADAVNRRTDVDAESTRLFQFAVNSIKGDPDVGDDSSLYEAAGYVRRSEKKSGLSRRTKTAPEQQKAA